MKAPLLLLPALGLGLAGGLSAQVGGGWNDAHEVLGEIGEIGFGLSMADNGDMNGDGIDDILIGAPGKNQATGGLYLYDGATQAKIWLINGTDQGERFGNEVASLGDMDGDGKAEFIVSAPGKPLNGMNYVGAVYYFSGAAQTNYLLIEGENDGDNFGDWIEVVPDMNGDGFKDFAVGADVADDGVTTDCGIVYIFNGKTGAEIRRYYGPEANSRFGSSIASMGDIDGDQYPDLLIGAKGSEVKLNGVTETDVGRVWLISGIDGSLILTVAGKSAKGFFGSAVANAGLLTNDDVPEFMVAAQEHTEPGIGAECGAVYIYDGVTGALLRKYLGGGEGDKFGGAIAGNVDINRDGKLDVIIGAPIEDLQNQPDSFAGAVYAYSGTDLIFRRQGQGYRERMGAEIELLGDDDGDGYEEFYVASPEYRPPNIHPRVGRLIHWEFDPYIFENTRELSASAGGTLEYDIDFPEEQANLAYKVLFSRGTGPVYSGNVGIPLSAGDLFTRTKNGDYGFLDNHAGLSGTLDAAGQALATVDQTSLPTGLVGNTFYVAAVALMANGFADESSAPMPITIIP